MKQKMKREQQPTTANRSQTRCACNRKHDDSTTVNEVLLMATIFGSVYVLTIIGLIVGWF